MRTLFSRLSIGILLVSLGACTWGSPDDSNGSTSSSPAISSIDTQAVQVTQPTPNAVVSSPLTIKGQARGTWYFEASFPVRLLDASGNEIAIAPAQAQGDWMTTDYVPFEVTLTFTTSSQTGVLILEKDNPSGLPEHAASVTIPVKFNP